MASTASDVLVGGLVERGVDTVFGIPGDGIKGIDTRVDLKGNPMAKKRKRKYSKSSGSDVKNEMRRYKRGKAKSGPGGKGGKVKSRKQAIAIGLSKARKKGKKVPKKRS